MEQQLKDLIFNFDNDISIDDLVRILTISRDIYYNGSGETISFVLTVDDEDYHFEFSDVFLTDKEFDDLERYVKHVQPSNPYFDTIGSTVRTGKEKLPFLMPSLEELEIGDYQKWIVDYDLQDEEILNSVKYDGISVGLVYNKGRFGSGWSRGDGEQGADISRHLSKMKIPRFIKDMETLYLRAECILSHSAWAIIKEQEPKYKTARGYVAGNMNSTEGSPLFYEHADIIITSIENRPDKSDLTLIETARSYNFKVAEYDVAKAKDLTDETLIARFDQLKNEIPYDIDGTVLKISKPTGKLKLPQLSSGKSPFGRKFKTSSSEAGAEVEVVDVHYTPSKSAFMKPRIQIAPTLIGGVTVTYTTGFNAGYIRDNQIGPGTKLYVVRSGDVIPDIRRVIESTSAKMPDIPMDEMYWTETGVDLVLKNPDAHPMVRMKRILDFFKKIGVPNIREASIVKLMTAGYKTEEDIIKLSLDEFTRILGDAQGQKIYTSIIAKLNPILPETLIGASQRFGRGIGIKKMKRVYERHTTFVLDREQLSEIEGFAGKTIDLYLSNIDAVNEFLTNITGYYTLSEKAAPASNELEGMVFVFTKVRDTELQSKLENKGATIGSSVSKKTNVVICNDPSEKSAKLDKARSMGVEIMSLSTAWNEFGN